MGVFLVTTDGVPGYDVVSVAGYVEVCRPVLVTPYAAGVKSLSTGRTIPLSDLQDLITSHRSLTLTELMNVAARMGANAVVGLRWSERPVTTTWMELHAYGTALVVESTRTRDQPLVGVPVRADAKRRQQERP